ncbi:MAG: TIM barrel protein [Woeseiaceae bacterium]|nr:TIM barrel protein [Woeseiaceae bacterium]
MKRRDLLKGIAAISVSPALASCAPKEKAPIRILDKVGIQLYTVRDRMVDDVLNTLTQLASIGYREMEFAGYFDHSPKEIKLFLDDLGLTSPSAHTNTQSMRETPEQLIEAALVVGHQYIVLAGLRPEERITLDDYRRHVDLINGFAEQCHEAGLKFAYHNHAYEFENLDGIRPMDLLLAETESSLMQVEIDFYWAVKAGVNPISYFEKYPGRFPLCHVKDMAPDGSMVDVGAGEIDFSALLAASQSGLRHYYVEHDYPVDSLASAKNSYSSLSKLEF